MRICRRGHTFEFLIAAFRKSSRSCSKPFWPQEHLNVLMLKGSGHRHLRGAVITVWLDGSRVFALFAAWIA